MRNKTIEEIQNEVAKDNGYLEWSNLFGANPKIMQEVCKRYAIKVAKASLNKAAHKMEYSIEDSGYTGTRLLRTAITDESNITLL